jgi:hypothetical protein
VNTEIIGVGITTRISKRLTRALQNPTACLAHRPNLRILAIRFAVAARHSCGNAVRISLNSFRSAFDKLACESLPYTSSKNTGMSSPPKNVTRVPLGGFDVRRTVYLYGVAGRERTAVAAAAMKMLRAYDWSKYLN